MDNSSQIIEDIKWFMFDNQSENDEIKNEKGFSHGLNFVSWTGCGTSFIVTDGKDKYRINVSKEA